MKYMSFFIRWIYDTGDKSSSYHIPGRIPGYYNTVLETAVLANTNPANINSLTPDDELYEVFNTASQTATPGTVLADGGRVIAVGNMAYWESNENILIKT